MEDYEGFCQQSILGIREFKERQFLYINQPLNEAFQEGSDATLSLIFQPKSTFGLKTIAVGFSLFFPQH